MPKITRALVDKLKPEGPDLWVWDSEIRGFAVRVRHTGSKTFYVKTKGKKINLGAVELVDLDDAKNRALDLIRNAKRVGYAEAGSSGKSKTVRELAEEHQKVHAPPKIRQSTADQYALYWRAHIIPAIGEVELAALTRLDVEKLQSRIRSKTSSNRSMSVLAKAINDMNTWGRPWPKIENHAAAVQQYREHNVERILEPDQVKSLYAELVARTRTTPAGSTPWLLLCLLLTGLRLSEWRLAQWSWLDLKRGVLKLPMTKANEKRLVHLDDAVVTILRKMPKRSDVWVFPNAEGTAPVGKPRKLWKSIKKAAGVDTAFRNHDLRHSFASAALVIAKLSIKEVSKLLGHSNVQTTMRYLHLLNDAEREASKKATGVIAMIAAE